MEKFKELKEILSPVPLHPLRLPELTCLKYLHKGDSIEINPTVIIKDKCQA
jgi:hypothetical protein